MEDFISYHYCEQQNLHTPIIKHGIDFAHDYYTRQCIWSHRKQHASETFIYQVVVYND